MSDILKKVKTVVLLMFENRSFDHMLGHLSIEGIQPFADGLHNPLNQDIYKNLYKGDAYYPFAMRNDSELSFDLPHEFDAVATQLALSNVNNRFSMNGFVEAYAVSTGIQPNPQSEPMSYFTSKQVPITSFLADKFCVCDRWFAPLPSSTQPNRTIAFTGETAIHSTSLRLIGIKDSIFQWLNRNGIRWKVYHDGLSYFVLYPGLWNYVLSNQFKDYESLYLDLSKDPADGDPQLFIVEPTYQDAPHIGSDHPNDNHAPLAIGWGEEFLRRTYEAVSANKKRWEETVFIVYYDEHGGFYDHVPPPFIQYNTTSDPPYAFNSMGPRIPAMIISPFVSPHSVCHDLMDHTSVLQFLSEVFTPNQPYSISVKNRSMQQPGIKSISAALSNDQPRDAPNVPAVPILVQTALGQTVIQPPSSYMAQSFESAAMEIMKQRPADVSQKYPELFQWKAAVEKARGGNL